MTHEILGSRLFYMFAYLLGDFKLMGRIPSQESNHPFRRSNSIYVRMPFTSIGMIWGWWKDTGWSEEDFMAYVDDMSLGEEAELFDDLYDENGDLPDLGDPEIRLAVRTAIAQEVAEKGLSLDDEWVIVQAFGLADNDGTEW